MIKYRLIFDEVKKYLNTPEAIVVTGMRRTGKTTLLKYFFDNIPSDNKFFLDLENPINRKYFEEDNYESIKRIFEFLGINFSKKAYIFCDEIQFVKNLPSIVKYFIDHYSVKFFLTGSASFYLKNLFTESLAGRKFTFEIFPLTFKEFLIFKDLKYNLPSENERISYSVYKTLIDYFKEYIQFGGFPGVVLKENIDEKKRALEDIFTSFFQYEITQLGDFRKNEIIRDLILLLMQRTGTRIDYLKIARDLKISRHTVKEYLSFLEGTYFIKRITPFSQGKDTEIRKSPKIYICDSGIIRHFVPIDEGRLFENAIFQNLRIYGNLNYYQKKSGIEIDFILNKQKAYEVKLNPSISDLKKLKRLSSELGIKDYKIISMNYSELNNVIYPFMI